MSTLLFVGGLGGWEILLIVSIILIFFGAKKIPELARGLGTGIREFKNATTEVKKEIEKEEEKPSHKSTETASTTTEADTAASTGAASTAAASTAAKPPTESTTVSPTPQVEEVKVEEEERKPK